MIHKLVGLIIFFALVVFGLSMYLSQMIWENVRAWVKVIVVRLMR